MFKELNILIFEAFRKLSNLNFSINGFKLETNFITGEVIFVDKSFEIYVLPYLTDRKIKISFCINDKLIALEIIELREITDGFIEGEVSTMEVTNRIINIIKLKIIEYETIRAKAK